MQFNVQDMVCDHCVSAITNALQAAFPQATIAINLAQHQVTVNHVDDQMAAQKVIEDAGYTPLPT